jgi:GR25 family glycosyltransferase involved in LPS biosynthesis
MTIKQMEPVIDTGVFVPRDTAKTFDILLYGYHDPKYYKFRDRLYQLLLHNQQKYKIKYIPHPGYNTANTATVVNHTVNEGLAEVISQSYLTICTSNDYDILVKKYLEAGCAGSVICGSLPKDYKGWRDQLYLVELTEAMSDHEILLAIDKALSNKKLLAQKGREQVGFFREHFGFGRGYDTWTSIVQGFSNIEPALISIPTLHPLDFNHIYVINLPRRTDRLASVRNRLKDIGWTDNYEVFLAVDGRDCIQDYQNQCRSLERTLIKTPGAYGLLKTYQRLVDDALAHKYERILVLEDDVYFHRQFNDLLNIVKVGDSPSVIYLGSNQEVFTTEQSYQIDNKRSYKTSDREWYFTYGTFAISYSRDFLVRLKSKLDSMLLGHGIGWPIDCLVWCMLKEQNQRGLVVYPQLVISDVTESDNNQPRDLTEFAKKRRWDLSLYSGLHSHG